MKKRILFTLFMAICLTTIHAQSQVDENLKELAEVVKQLRTGNKTTPNSVVAELSRDKKPKITLMDEIRIDKNDKDNEVKGSKGNRFKLNQVIAYVYNNQNQKLESKRDVLNGNEKDIHYSAIEKTIKRGTSVTYMLSGRKGKQDFIIIPYNKKTEYTVSARVSGGQTVTGKKDNDDCRISLPPVTPRQTIYITITCSGSKGKDDAESFAILNYNPQK